MDEDVKQALTRAVEQEPFARLMNLELVELGEGTSVVEMVF